MPTIWWPGTSGSFGSVSSPIGTQITQAVGFAWAAKLKREPLATAVYFEARGESVDGQLAGGSGMRHA